MADVVRGQPAVIRAFTLTPETGTPVVVSYGILAIDSIAVRAGTSWRRYTPVGSVTPVRQLTARHRVITTISGDLVPGRLAAGQLLVNALIGLQGQAVTVAWAQVTGYPAPPSAGVGAQLVTDVRLSLRYGGGMVTGGDWSLELIATDAAPAPTDPTGPTTPQAAPALNAIPDATWSFGETIILRVGANVGFPGDKGYHIRLTGSVPDWLTWNLAGVVSGTAPSVADSGSFVVELRDNTNTVLDSQTVRYTVQAAAVPTRPPPAPVRAVRFGDLSGGAEYSLSKVSGGLGFRYLIPMLDPDDNAVRRMPSGWTLTVTNLPAGLDTGTRHPDLTDRLIFGAITGLTQVNIRDIYVVGLALSGPADTDASSATLTITVVA